MVSINNKLFKTKFLTDTFDMANNEGNSTYYVERRGVCEHRRMDGRRHDYKDLCPSQGLCDWATGRLGDWTTFFKREHFRVKVDGQSAHITNLTRSRRSWGKMRVLLGRRKGHRQRRSLSTTGFSGMTTPSAFLIIGS